jgi:RNA-directed DNA polymerase
MNSKPVRQLWLPLLVEGELGLSDLSEENPTERQGLMEQIVAPENLRAAYGRVVQNKGAPGVDGMTVDELALHLRAQWPAIRQQLLAGTYRPAAVRRKELPKPGGGIRVLGIPTVQDRFIQQATLQVLQAAWDPTFSEESFGFRPGRSAHQAVARAQEHYRQGCRRVVDLDLEKFFDRVNHEKLMALVAERVSDKRGRRLIREYLKAGMASGDVYLPRDEGTPQGGPLSPLLANLLLDRLDKELEKRGHRFVRYADDCNIYVGSQRAGIRVKASVTRYLSQKLKLKVNEAKSAVARPRDRSFLGFSIGRSGAIQISAKTIHRLKERVRDLTGRTRGRAMRQIVGELAVYLRGWRAYFRIVTGRHRLQELTSWILRRLRSYQWKQWGPRGYRELRRRGVSRRLAWNTRKSAHGPWRLSHSPALAIALPTGHFVGLGIPLLHHDR